MTILGWEYIRKPDPPQVPDRGGGHKGLIQRPKRKNPQPTGSFARIIFASSFQRYFSIGGFRYAASAKSQCKQRGRPILRPMRVADAEGNAVLPILWQSPG